MKILTAWLRHYLPALPVDDLQLAEDLTLRGIAVEGVHPLSQGHLFEMDITTNRVDAMNHYGIAREAATIYNLPLVPLGANIAAIPTIAPFPVRIDSSAETLCGRFTAQVLRNVTIAPSDGLIADFFALLGQKQISNAVDASNFTLLGMGHPTHAFDLDKLEGGIVVRLAYKGEKLKLLDGTERTLEADDLVVADEKKAVGLAGVMGGWDSMITPETRNILVEAAWFDPASIRRSSRRHLLHTDASHRFERGADFNACPTANALVSQLILTAGGHAEGALIDITQPAIAAKTSARSGIALSVQQVQRHLGTTLDDAEGESALTSELVQQYLTALGCTLASADQPTEAEALTALNEDPQIGGPSAVASHISETDSPDSFHVQLPSWRLDLEREIDLIEEIARVYGYNHFANTLPTPGIVIAHPTAAAEAAVRTRLLALGFSEAISSTFASQSDSDLFYAPAAPGQGTIAMENPLSEEASLLRPTLIPGMVAMLSNNLNRDVKEVRLFEQGHTFTGSTAAVTESAQLSLGLTTGTPQATAPHSAADAPIFELKGAIESLVSLFTLPGGPAALTFSTESTPAWLQQGRAATAMLNNVALGYFGELTQAETQKRKLRQPIFLAQLDLTALYALPLKRVTARDLSRFQAVERDFSFVFPDSIQWHTVTSAIQALAILELQSLAPIEVWRDKKKYPGVYSLLVRTVFQSHHRTLREEELTQWHSQIIAALTQLGGTIRA
ncbi:MAG: phenylalanyl-tRNA synthetase, beta subunit [Acidobacteriaceae bacterium]|nr:phenylalanyl-tRNA synthetase, beta subunit [Acidobacteriaceae bacterium]